jgi:hypothetical protein
MSYYMGDYYRGDYYRGDPGIGSFLGGLFKSAVHSIPGVGMAVEAVGGAISAARKSSAIVKARELATGAAKLASKHPVMSAAAAAGAGVAAGAMAGRHRAGKMAMGAGEGHRRRRMRVTNPKALRRAIRRTTGFAKLAMRTIHLVHPRKKVRFGGFKKRVRS